MAGLELLTDQGFRIDGRKANELRRLECRMGVSTEADGSAYIELGNTKVIALVHGPHEISGNKQDFQFYNKAYINCEYRMAMFAAGERRRRRLKDRRSQEISSHICQAFESAILTEDFPQSQIDIFVEVLQADGGNYSACVNACTLALVDAGIPMKELVCACSAGLINEVPLVDLNHFEESLGQTGLNIAILPKSQYIVLQEMTSRLHKDHFSNILDKAMEGCMDVCAILESVIRSYCQQKMSDIDNSNLEMN